MLFYMTAGDTEDAKCDGSPVLAEGRAKFDELLSRLRPLLLGCCKLPGSLGSTTVEVRFPRRRASTCSRMSRALGAASYDVGDEIWQESLADAIRAEAETIAGYAGSDLLGSPDQAHRDAPRDRIVDEMRSALVSIGDFYRAPDGVAYSLIDTPQ